MAIRKIVLTSLTDFFSTAELEIVGELSGKLVAKYSATSRTACLCLLIRKRARFVGGKQYESGKNDF